MFLKNYTSDVPVAQTIHRIEQVLIRCGVNGITKEYVGTDGEIAAVTFRIELPNFPPITIRLPADKEKAQQALWLNYANGDKLSEDGTRMSYNSYKKKRKSDFKEQGERTAWKLMQDWVEVQLSLIQTQQAEFLQVFLPYAIVKTVNGPATYYEAFKQSGFKALLPEKSES